MLEAEFRSCDRCMDCESVRRSAIGSKPNLQVLAVSVKESTIERYRYIDAERERTNNRKSSIARLDRVFDDARAKGWTVMDMKKDWQRVLAFDKS